MIGKIYIMSLQFPVQLSCQLQKPTVANTKQVYRDYILKYVPFALAS